MAKCNMCGNGLDLWDIQEDFSISRHIGYGSIHDGDQLDLHLCCDCLDKLVEACKISPITYIPEVDRPEVTE